MSFTSFYSPFSNGIFPANQMQINPNGSIYQKFGYGNTLLGNSSFAITQFGGNVLIPKTKNLQSSVSNGFYLFSQNENIKISGLTGWTYASFNWTQKSVRDNFVSRFASGEPAIIKILDDVAEGEGSKAEKKSKFREILELIIQFGNTTANVINAIKGGGSGVIGGTGGGGIDTMTGGGGTGTGSGTDTKDNTVRNIAIGVGGFLLVKELLKD